MKLHTLKTETYESWKRLSAYNSAIVQPEHFKPEVRSFGDLRCKSTWENAYCAFTARNISDSCLDAYELITIQFNYSPEAADYVLRHQIFEAFLALPHGLELIKAGLEQLFSSDFTPQEREEADGFFKLVQEKQAGTGSLPVGSFGQLAPAGSAAAG